jgi:hypothetical protein
MDNLDEERLDLVATELEEPRDLLDADDEAPIIRLVNSLLFQAVKDRASDIHIEPFERDLAVRFRIDGILYDIISPPKRFQPVISSRVKIMAGLNIAEKRLPQDGRIRIRLAGKDVDIRVSTVPTAFGERVVMRLLDRSGTILNLEELGLLGRKHDVVSNLIKQPQRLLEIRLRLARKPDNDVGRERNVPLGRLQPLNPLHVLVPRVLSRHPFKHRRRSALHRQMDLVAERFGPVDGVDDVAREIARMRCGEPDPADPLHMADRFQQLGEVPAGRRRVAVAVHILAQQLNLGVARPRKLPRL